LFIFAVINKKAREHSLEPFCEVLLRQFLFGEQFTVLEVYLCAVMLANDFRGKAAPKSMAIHMHIIILAKKIVSITSFQLIGQIYRRFSPACQGFL